MKTLKDIKKEEGKRLTEKLNLFTSEEQVEYLKGYRSIMQAVKSKKHIEGIRDAINYMNEVYYKNE